MLNSHLLMTNEDYFIRSWIKKRKSAKDEHVAGILNKLGLKKIRWTELWMVEDTGTAENTWTLCCDWECACVCVNTAERHLLCVFWCEQEITGEGVNSTTLRLPHSTKVLDTSELQRHNATQLSHFLVWHHRPIESRLAHMEFLWFLPVLCAH